ncbi:arabinose 5-phosphate isomerase [Bacteroidetes bacterium UKL13-3]|jgi:arabinose-5-phosphate isomerase|nr:arabinose 5-phosphate isomerase [Bacteroidetes bacterium UKL13-3]HCP92490.1 KpsF/GutQ family sugar-phosphate isomerase [Bacteroidota bacterium]
MTDYKKYAKEVFQIEAKALADLSKQLDENFNKAVETVLKSKGRLVICGVGKSGLVGAKISATLASTGTPSMFMHPVEAFHGDLGMLKKEDVLVAISYSGETEELLKLIPYIKAASIKVIGMSGNPKSTLAKNSDYHLNVKVYKEACPLELAPTSSTTATLAMGDALAVALMKARNFKPEDFAKFHPGGSLGRKLLTTVESCMFKDKLPVVKPTDSIQQVINTMSSGRLGLAVVVAQNKVAGIITDGDLRRAMDKHTAKLFALTAKHIMTAKPRTINKKMMMAEAEELMNAHKITSLLVADNKGKLEGIVQIYSLNN